jgi:hypothetical protein
MKRWALTIGFLAFAGLAWAGTDAYFAGRSLRMTRKTNGTCEGQTAYSCIWFDTLNGFRYWNGSSSHHVATGVPTAGRIVVGSTTVTGDGGTTTWTVLNPGTANQVLSTNITDAGVTTLKWVAH